MNKDQIKKFVEDNPTLVKAKPTLNPELHVLKYNNRVFYKNLWTPELLECRGTVIDKDWNIVSRPFTKIFNYGEKKAPKITRDETVTASKKINGFMGAVSVYNDELVYSTTGTIDSEFADMVREAVDDIVKDTDFVIYINGTTFNFEIVHSDDPHIIVEEAGVYLLNIRENEWDADQHYFPEFALDIIAEKYEFKRPSWKVDTWQNIKDEVKTCNHEGYVVWTEDGRELKIKSPFYLVTKFLGRMGDNNVELMYENTKEFKKKIDEEFYNIVGYVVRDNTKEEYLAMEKQDRIDMIRKYVDEEYALNEL